MSNEQNFQNDPNQPKIYQIRLQGYLSSQWADWFDGMTITLEDDGNTLLTGPIVDQAALYGVLKKVRDFGLPLLSLHAIMPEQELSNK